MGRLLYLVPLLLVLVITGYFVVGLSRDPQTLPSVLLDRPVPPTNLPPLMDGAPGLTNADLKGAPRLVNFWASWCAPCRIEHPLLMDLKARGVPVDGIAYKDKPADSKRFLAQLGDPFTRVVKDEAGRTAIDWGVYGVPETYVIDANGVIRHRHVGALTREAIDRTILPLLRSLAK